MKILFILPYDNTYRYHAAFIPSISYQPLTLSTLAALVPSDITDITLIDEGVQKFDYSKENYDIVGISIVTSSSKRGYQLADSFRKRGSYVIMGGHHASLLPEEARNHADTVFVGSGEKTVPQFFIDFLNGSPERVYTANAKTDYNVNTHSTCTEKAPAPRRDLMTMKGYLKQPTIIADYGCGNNCNYCVIHSFWGKKSKRPIKDVIQEMKQLGAKEYLFLDPSPFSDKAYARELFYELSKLKIKWAGLSTLDVTDEEELLDLLEKSGCIGTLLGFESFHEEDLKSLSKHKNKVDQYADIVGKLHEKKIAVLGTFMLGLDHDTVESIRQLPDLIEAVRIDVPRFAIITPYPQTPLFKELDAQKRIFNKDWSYYDSVHAVFEPKNISPGDLETEFIRLWKESYHIKRIIHRIRYTPQRKLTTFITNMGFQVYANRIEKMMNTGE